jgi:hypothetical protein
LTRSVVRFLSITILVVSAPTASGDEWVEAYVTGAVRDADGKPVAGVTVWSRDQYGCTVPTAAGNGPANDGYGITDASGRYRFAFQTKLGRPVDGLLISAQAREWTRADHEFRSDKPVTQAGADHVLDIRLTRGEVLAGVAKLPIRVRESWNGQSGERRQYFVRVRNADFQQLHKTEPGGRFEIWVPKGRYTLALTTDYLDSAISLDNVASGTRGIELVKKEAALGGDLSARAFDALWDDMSENYSYFELKKIDWQALKQKYRQRAVSSETLPAFVDVLGEMLGELDDGHVWFVEPEGAMVAWRHNPVRSNLNSDAIESTLAGASSIGNSFARVGTVQPEGFGVVRIVRQSRASAASVQEVVEFIRAHEDAPGFVVDLRTAEGGSEPLAELIAREFAVRDTVYARSKFRDGPRPSDFGPVYDRVLKASDRPFTKPVVCLLGPGCVSSGEAFAKMMKCLPHVTTLGLPTRGSSGNPRPFTLPGVPVTVMYSRWVDMLPDGTPIEGRGVPPQIVVDLPETAYANADPTWERAVNVLRERVRAAK